MAQITVEDVYRGDKYNVLDAAGRFKREGDSLSTVVEDESSSPFVRWNYIEDVR